mmetsp:Transcript_15677/g.47268  ORF Transcript_15677/g.47268 Transcript_15677/m.47268 type:complete len:148 (+) Transcript_15677:179-622(+)|eukprot:CAMPEP_0206151066 /NCGR_PEP_ID=MMETSP1473-20131121/38631_1 /ASSEMBLY_ACC=CAM_ASM_001109 /TAXON_ID=1461547 /ORGANISM="Stichococcus sp, Strain RCC1054" /LENGTH=147 /DNA_ID=CAMNT_0053548601 /DNA_START=156 /DNA_END=599 /DNA_ORIENTATION=+
MPKGAKGTKGVGRRGTHSHKSKKTHKLGLRSTFLERHIDQVWEDVRKAEPVKSDTVGPLGTTDRGVLDEDVPAYGRNFCTTCSRYFVTELALATHSLSKDHKRRIKVLKGARPHNATDAEKAGNMGTPDNGPRLRSADATAPAAMDQ